MFSIDIMSFFASLGDAVDSTLTNILREFGTQVAGQCPTCSAVIAAPIGSRVRCSECQQEVTMSSALTKFTDALYETSETVADAAIDMITSTGLVVVNPPPPPHAPSTSSDGPDTEMRAPTSPVATISRRPLQKP